MTLSATTSRASYAGNGSTTVFAVPFKFNVASDLVVILQTAGVDVVQTLTTHYTVSGAGDDSGGSITFVTPPGGTATVIIYRDPSLTQLLDLLTGDALPAESLENALDILTMLVQRLADRIGRTPELVAGDTDGSGRHDFNSNRGINLADPVGSQDAATKAWVAAQLLAAALADYTGTVTTFAATLLDDANAAAALTTLGISAFIQTLLNDADAATAQGTLGISAFIKTLLDDADAATARATLGVTTTPQENVNLLVNGDFQIWQLGTTIDATTPVLNSDGNYVCDQWVLLSDGNDIVDVFKETSVVPPYAPAALKLVMQGTNKKAGIFQPLPADLVRSFSGQTVSLQFKARNAGSGDLTLIRAAVVAWNGTPDSITRDIVDGVNWQVQGTNPTLAAGWAYANTPAGLTALTTAYQDYSIANITIPASTDNVGIFIWVDDTAYTASDALYVADVKLEIGTAASSFARRSYAEELALCERFFEKSFAVEVAPANNIGTAGALSATAVGSAAAHALGFSWRFRQRKLKAPSVTTYNVGAGTAGYWKNRASASYIAAASELISDSGCRIYNSGATANANNYHIHAVADARL